MTQYKKYGLTKEQFEEMKAAQLGQCALHSKECKGGLCIDHKRDSVRGLLCTFHNILIGQFEVALPYLNVFKSYVDGQLTTFIKTTKLTIAPRCLEDGCEEAVHSRGYCSRHYSNRFRYYEGNRKVNRI